MFNSLMILLSSFESERRERRVIVILGKNSNQMFLLPARLKRSEKPRIVKSRSYGLAKSSQSTFPVELVLLRDIRNICTNKIAFPPLESRERDAASLSRRSKEIRIFTRRLFIGGRAATLSIHSPPRAPYKTGS